MPLPNRFVIGMPTFPFFAGLRELSQETFSWGFVRIERTRAHYFGDDHITSQFFVAHPPKAGTKLFDGLHHCSSQIPTHVVQRVGCDVECRYPRQAFSYSLGDNLVHNFCVRLAGLFPSIRMNLRVSRDCLHRSRASMSCSMPTTEKRGASVERRHFVNRILEH
jgi:hypothetical protein